jgi:phosphoserine phosphatase
MTENVLTMIAGPGFASSWPAVLRLAVEALERQGASVSPVDWLAADIAVDLPFNGLDPDPAEAAVRAALGRESGATVLDLVAQPRTGRRRRLLVADMESTIIANEMLDELAEMLSLGPRVAELTRRAMNGDIDFAGALRERVALLRDVPVSVLDEARRRIRISPGAVELVATMRAAGAYTALVSGGFRSFTGPVGSALGFDIEIANELLVSGATLAGTVREPILDASAKLATLRRLASEHGLDLTETLAVGDGANDLGMIEAAGLGVAYHAKPSLRAQARCRIDHADLTALLYVQGYRASEIVRAPG